MLKKQPLKLARKAIMLALLPLSFFTPWLHAQTIRTTIINQTPDSRYTDHGNGTVTDNVTSLMWSKCSLGQASADCSGTTSTHNWQNALVAAESSALAGYNDWRLPNIKELQSLVALDRYSPAINLSLFPNTPSESFWSSSPNANNSTYAWVVSFNYGHDNNLDRDRSGSHRVRLVRAGQ